MKLNTTAVIVILLLTISNCFALDIAEWEYKADIELLQFSKNDHYKFALSPEIYNFARNDLSDLRLVDANNQQVPYVLERPKNTTAKAAYSPAIINQSTNRENASLVTLDFAQQILKNSVEVETRGNNFRRRVRIEGSNDNIDFFTVVSNAYVFAVGDKQNRTFNKIDMPRNNWRYLRITIWPMSSETTSPVIKNVKAFKTERKIADYAPIKPIPVKHAEDPNNKQSIYIYDLTHRNLPVNKVRLDIAEGAFYRHVTVQGRDMAKRTVEIRSEDNKKAFQRS